MLKRIALVGAHSASKLGAPFKNPEWTVWACSSKNMDELPRWDAWFELHNPLGPEDYIEWLALQPLVYTRFEAPLPGARLYPEAAMRKQFGPFFFTSSLAYMLALAIAEKPDEIGLWGIHMASDEEYHYQRPGCHYFIQRAWDHGIKVTVAPQSRLLEPPKEQW
jgi:hypothetical protein